ncbi:uncharacterized protein LOC142628829 [Castanea sativa]|uniref:uncharacterized protein LOC142628829 n=1 Tax=Castanea sativa TaxID=21020 RepID=UPI003F64BC1B
MSPHAVSSALVKEGRIQKPVYYTSWALRGAEGRYSMIKKLAFALITASRKLRHYFQAHVFNVLMDHPLKKAMNKLEAPRSAIKAQVLADFIAEFTPSQDELDKEVGAERGIGVILKSPEGDKLEYTARLQYQNANNEAEYKALLKGLELAKSLGVESIIVKGDSQLVINQVNGMCEAKEDLMKKYLNKVKRLIQKFKEVGFVQLPREEHMEVDALARGASIGGVMDEYDRIQYMSGIDLPDIQQIGGREN